MSDSSNLLGDLAPEESRVSESQVSESETGLDVGSEESEGKSPSDTAVDASIEVVDVEVLESQRQERAYEVYQDGGLTYFQYFLEDEDSIFGPGEGNWRDSIENVPQSFLSVGAVGVGVLAATFGAGLLVAEATNRSSISDEGNNSFQAQADDQQDLDEQELKAADAAAEAKAVTPESLKPDWSNTQQALITAAEQSAKSNLGSSNPTLNETVAPLKETLSPASSAVTAKLAPLSMIQPWSAVSLPSVNSPNLNSPPVVTTASLPTPVNAAPAEILRPIQPSYEVVQPIAETAPQPLPTPPEPLPALEPLIADSYESPELPLGDGDRQLQARMEDLRDRMAQPLEAGSVAPTVTDDVASVNDSGVWDDPGPWVSSIPVPAETTLGNALDMDRSGDNNAQVEVSSTPAADLVDPAAVAATVPSAVLPPVDQVVPPPARSLNEAIVPPVAGLLPGQLEVTGASADVPVADPSDETVRGAVVVPEPSTSEDSEGAKVSQDRGESNLEVASSHREVQPVNQSGLAPLQVTTAVGEIELPVPAPVVSHSAMAQSSTTSVAAIAPASATTATGATLSDQSAPQNLAAVNVAQPIRARRSSSQSEVSNTATEATRQPLRATTVQSVVELFQQASTEQSLALSPLVAQAALAEGDAWEAEESLPFQILSVNASDYQKLWRERDFAFAPTHGFVDYGQSMIFLPMGQAEAASLDRQDSLSKAAFVVSSAVPAVRMEAAAVGENP